MGETDELRSNRERNSVSPNGPPFSRRVVLMSAAVAAGAATGVSAGPGQATSAADYGAPLAELHFPAGALTLEQKAAMIKGVTDVLVRATQLPPDQVNNLWVQLFETTEGGWGFGGQVFVPRSK